MENVKTVVKIAVMYCCQNVLKRLDNWRIYEYEDTS